MFVPVGGGQLYAYGTRSMVDAQIETVGLTTVFGDIDDRANEASFEEFLERDPDVLIILTIADLQAGKDAFLSLPGAADLTAVRNDDILMMKFDSMDPPTPLSVEGLEKVAQAFGPQPVILADRGKQRHAAPGGDREPLPHERASMTSHDGPLRLGAFLTTRRDGQRDKAVFDEALDIAMQAERLGYGSVWLNEHRFIDYGRCPAPLAMAAFILGQTSRIRVGTADVLLALHHPLEVAEQAALVDQLSGGRLDLGVGKGAYTRDLAAFEVPPALLDERWKANLHMLTDILDSGQVTTTGPSQWVPGLARRTGSEPQPRNSRYIATATHTIEWAAQHGCGLLLPTPGIHEKAELVALSERFADQHDADPTTVSHVATAVAQVGDTRPKRWRRSDSRGDGGLRAASPASGTTRSGQCPQTGPSSTRNKAGTAHPTTSSMG